MRAVSVDQRRAKAGITFVEVIVVIGIIAMLVALLLPVGAAAAEKGRETACSSNLHQIYVAMTMYASDNESPDVQAGIGDIMNLPNASLLLPYVRSHDVFYCPDTDPALHKKYWSTYLWQLNYQGSDDFSKQYTNQLDSELDKKLLATPVVICQMHYLTFYRPREDSDPALNGGIFELKLLLDGSVQHGFFPDLVSSFNP